MINATSRSLYPREGRGTRYIGWAPGHVWMGAENLAHTGFRSADRPARSESLYRLSYPGPCKQYNPGDTKSDHFYSQNTINVSHHFDSAYVGDVNPVPQLNNDAKTTESCLFLNKELKSTVSLSSGFRLSCRRAFKRERNLHSEPIAVGGTGVGVVIVTENTQLVFTAANRFCSGTCNEGDLRSH